MRLKVFATIRVIPIAKGTVGIGRMHAEDEDDHRPANVVDKQEASGGLRHRCIDSAPVWSNSRKA